MPTAVFEQGLASIERGDLDHAQRLARGLLTGAHTRGEALYLLGRAYQKQNKPHLAQYLFEEAAALPSPPDVGVHLEEVKQQVYASGWTEDFSDRGHRECTNCGLYFRAEYDTCPYCSIDSQHQEAVAQAPHALDWEDDFRDKASKLTQAVMYRAKSIAEKDELRAAMNRARELGDEASEKTRRLLESDTAKHLQQTTRETGNSLARHVQEFVKEERSQYETASPDQRRAITIKWILMVIGVLLLIRVLMWIL